MIGLSRHGCEPVEWVWPELTEEENQGDDYHEYNEYRPNE